MRSRAPSLHSAMATRLPAACSASTCCGHGLEHIGAGLGALGREIVPGARADIDHVARLRHREGRQPRQRRSVEPLFPFVFRQIKPLRRQRLVGRRHALLQRLAARVVIVGDLRQAAHARRLRPDARARAACPANSRTASRACCGTAAASAPCRDSGGPRSPLRTSRSSGRRRAELGDIAGAEAADGFGDELEFRDRHQIEPAQLPFRCVASAHRRCGSSPARRRRNRTAPACPCRAETDRECRRAPRSRRARARSRRG